MEIIGYICAVAATGAFIALAVYEWLLWRERTKAETLKFTSEAYFYDMLGNYIGEAEQDV